jgi:membrane-associated protease RseP (regulator of RpoE activity)
MPVAAPNVPPPPIAVGTASPHTDGRQNMDCAMCHQMLPGSPRPRGRAVAAPNVPPPPIAMGTPSPHTDGRQNMDCAMCHQMLPGRAAQGGMAVAAPGAGGGYQFAAPPGSLAMNVVGPQGQAQHGRGQSVLGATLTPLSPTLGQQTGQMAGRGVHVGAVAAGTPAAQAGLKPGDVLVKVDGRPVRAPHEVMALLSAVTPGSSVRLGVLREGELRGMQIVVGPAGLAAAAPAGMAAPQPGMPPVAQAMPPMAQGMPPVAGARPAAPRIPTEFNWQGLEIETFQTVRPMPGMAAQPPMPPVPAKGAVVGEVLVGSRAALAGLKMNDVILEVNNRPVGTAAQLDAAIKAATASGQAILLKASRNGQEFMVAM